MKVVLIPCGKTAWREQGRLLGRVELNLAEAGNAEVSDWISTLRPLGLSKIFHSPDELATGTAKRIAAALDIPSKSAADLHEVDIGLWAGLTETELKARYAKAHRQLVEAPLNVSPPGGEELKSAAERVSNGLRKKLKKNGKDAIGMVMRPFSLALARCALGELPPEKLWEAQRGDAPIVIEQASPKTDA